MVYIQDNLLINPQDIPYVAPQVKGLGDKNCPLAPYFNLTDHRISSQVKRFESDLTK
jgi:hypothetical protein